MNIAHDQVMQVMKPPYLMTREEWQSERELCRSDSNGQHGYTKGCGNAHIAKIGRLELLCYGVNKWLHDKAIQGDEDALFRLSYSYDTHDMILLKAMEEGKIDLPPEWVFTELSADANRMVINTYMVKWYEWGAMDMCTILTIDNLTIKLDKQCVNIERIQSLIPAYTPKNK